MDRTSGLVDRTSSSQAKIALFRSLFRVRIRPPDFLTLWKDADPDIPILKQAQAEYAKLQ